MITLVEKKPLLFKLRMKLEKLIINNKIKYASKRGLRYVEVTVYNKAVRKELIKYYVDNDFNVWVTLSNMKIEWNIVKE